LQGDIDKVVPKEQSEAIYNNINKRGGVVEYKLYPGEGHGFRKEATIRDAFERELAFYERILKLKQA
jgi:dipeptidyl aminopeptidase/acylaminoacyl peptidase